MDEQTTDGGRPDHTDVVVVGGGIAGLLAAVTAAEREPRPRVVVLDPRPLGGRARCDERDGYKFNRGPRALYVGGPAERALVAAGVDVAAGSKPELRQPTAIHRGELYRFPATAGDSLRTTLLSPAEKVSTSRALARLWRDADPDQLADVTLAAWLDRRRLTGAVRGLVEALVRVSTYANAPEVMAAGPALANARAGIAPGVRYLDGGWQRLVDQLVEIAGARGVIVVPTGARSVRSTGDRVVVTADDGGTIDAAAVVIAAGGPAAAASLLGGAPASWPTLGPPSTAACLELGVRRVPGRRFALGIDEPLYASVHCPPARLAPEGHAVVHLMRYQPVGDEQPADDQHARLRALARSIGVADEDVVAERFLSRMVVTHALPIATAGGLAGRAPVEVREHPGVLLAGDWVGAEGLLLDAAAASAVVAGRQAAARSTTMVPA